MSGAAPLLSFTAPRLNDTAPRLNDTPPRLNDTPPRLELGTFSAAGPRLVLVGAWSPLFDLIGGARELRDGRVELYGEPAAGSALSRVGLLRRDAPLPGTWALRELLVESARLLGVGRRAAARRADEVLVELGASAYASWRLSKLGPAQRRVAALGCALLGEPAVLALEEPLGGLEPPGQEHVLGVLERVARGRALLASVAELPGSPAEEALAADGELLILSAGRLVARGTRRELSAAARSYRVVAARSVDALLSELVVAGYEVRRMLSSGEAATLLVADAAGVGTVPLLAASLAADAPLLELEPMAFEPAPGPAQPLATRAENP